MSATFVTTDVQYADWYSEDNTMRIIYLRHWSDGYLASVGDRLLTRYLYSPYEEDNYKLEGDIEIMLQPDGWYIWKATLVKGIKEHE